MNRRLLWFFFFLQHFLNENPRFKSTRRPDFDSLIGKQKWHGKPSKLTRRAPGNNYVPSDEFFFSLRNGSSISSWKHDTAILVFLRGDYFFISRFIILLLFVKVCTYYPLDNNSSINQLINWLVRGPGSLGLGTPRNENSIGHGAWASRHDPGGMSHAPWALSNGPLIITS